MKTVIICYKKVINFIMGRTHLQNVCKLYVNFQGTGLKSVGYVWLHKINRGRIQSFWKGGSKYTSPFKCIDHWKKGGTNPGMCEDSLALGWKLAGVANNNTKYLLTVTHSNASYHRSISWFWHFLLKQNMRFISRKMNLVICVVKNMTARSGWYCFLT